MRPVNFTHYTPIIRFLAEPDRDLLLSPDVITRCRAAEWMEELRGGMRTYACAPHCVLTRVRARARVSVRREATVLISTFLTLRFLFPVAALSRNGRASANANA